MEADTQLTRTYDTKKNCPIARRKRPVLRG